MAAPNPNSVFAMNNLVLKINLLDQVNDLAKSIKEYSIGKADATRDIDLCYGASFVETTDPDKLQQHIVIGKGLEKSAINNIAEIIASGDLSEDEIGISILYSDPSTDVIRRQQINGEYEIVSNCYAFGSVFVETGTVASNFTSSISAATLLGANNKTIFVSKDITLEEAIDLVKNNIIEDITPISDASSTYDDYAYLKLYDFILDITYYDGTFQNSRVDIFPIDRRKVRSLFSFSTEELAVFLTPRLIRNERNVASRHSTIRAEIKDIIKEWVYIPNWSPNFINYWKTSAITMPEPLKLFLKNELGIII
jgi:hypothetical protein